LDVAGNGKPGRKKIELDSVEVECLAAEGLAEYQIAARLGVHPDTFAARKKDEEAIRDALKRGRRRAHGTIANAIFEAARKVVDDPRYSTIAIWYSKAQMGWKDRTVIEHEGEVNVGGVRDRLAEKLARRAVAGGDS